MQLFKNRAGLKKAHASLQDEVYELKERVKQQETATTRVQEQMEASKRCSAIPTAGYARAGVLPAARPVACVQRAARDSSPASSSASRKSASAGGRRSNSTRSSSERGSTAEHGWPQAEDVRGASGSACSMKPTQRLRALNRFWNYFRRRKLAVEVAHQRVHGGRGARQEAAAMREEHRRSRTGAVPGVPRPRRRRSSAPSISRSSPTRWCSARASAHEGLRRAPRTPWRGACTKRSTVRARNARH